MKYHLIGERGVSMRGIKKYLLAQGDQVTGSDLKTGGHSASNITADIDVVVRTSAVNPGSEGWAEVAAAERIGIPVIKRSELIGRITKNKNLIAVSGMHGKTTITSMVGLMMIEAGLDPTVLVGEDLKEFDDDVIRMGHSDWFVLEACEYDRSFLDFYPKVLIISNIEEEHLDTYPGGLPEIKAAFVEYIAHVPADGVIIACGDDENVRDVLAQSKTAARIVFYGNNSDKYRDLGFRLTVPGKHNILNALAVMALADYLAVSRDLFEKSLVKFRGAHRRLELKGQYNGADLLDDYGHHPTEIATTIDALAEKYPDKKKIVIFWPHQYRRVLPLLDKFANCFVAADEAIIKPIYFVPGRDEILPVSSQDIVEKANEVKDNARFIETDEEIIALLKKELNENCVLLTIGIPPVYKIIDQLLEENE
jgi:UDP-N-acetylmuramate--alanine ligase